ncbi:MFS general substrate transporter [Bimuria novae-zelandiae CBS 107.79]|uniref:MFS general substrate transporter n=1 Tax=Bimuria novae-zelandiae CBS 107.79 TaxID=1447943 RepID=A0A6A5UP89_9PLEO|nr:MFS general substrate transporter [Bimuria novae-zelandiae CBS 107.79]
MASPPRSVEILDVDIKVMHDTKLENIEFSVDGLTWTPEEEKKVVRKIDTYLMPMMWLMYLLSYMDRTNIGNAKIAGMQADLSLTSSQYSICLVVFFVTYVVFEVPSNMLIVRIRPSIYLPAIMTVWGALTCCMAAIKDYHHLIVLRIFVGMFEAGFGPGMLLLMSSWYKREEQSKRFGIYISAAILSGAFGGLLAGAITGELEGAAGYRGWRWLFIIEGAATIFVAILSYFVLPDFPGTTSKLTEREKQIACARLMQSGISTAVEGEERMGKGKSFLLAVRDWRTTGFVIGYMVIVGSGTLSYFYPTLVNGLGYTDTVTAQYMTVPIYGVAFVCAAVTAYFADSIPNHRGLIIACWLAFSLITSIIICVVYDFTARYALLVLMAAGIWTSNAISLSFAGASFGDMRPEVRGVSLALVNAMGNLASIYGAYLFPADDKPKYLLGFGVISGMLGVGVVTYIVMHISTKKRNGLSGFF